MPNLFHFRLPLPSLPAIFGLAVPLALSGCLSPLALDRAVVEYDKATADTLSRQLLLNIARAHQHQPLHFTGVSNIAATFNFQLNAGATPAVTGDNGSLLTPVFGGTVSENPTISIVPIEGEEFTKRMLTPFPESKLTMLLRQGVDVDLLLRLLAGELRLAGGAQNAIYSNRPADAEGYRVFRQAVLHLSSVQDRHQLFAEPLMFEREWLLPAGSVTVEHLAELEKYYAVEFLPQSGQVRLKKRVVGRIVLTNYDPALLSNDERRRLHEEAGQGADNDVGVDIRAGYPGGEWPLHGVFRLRSFHNVLNFIGEGLGDEPEFAVDKHPATPAVRENPVQTLALQVGADDGDLSVEFGGQNYALQPETGYQWNREGFRLLCQIFQMTVANLNQQGAPTITIAK
ncbi:hypothetical protein ACH518_17160 [Methylomonas sp. HW2-6]|uniref:hypothetical protein n=1 Tax=Methylomonas sp. HW2-6 TaxID=3376687 RepID=UPI004040F5A1